MRIISSFTSRLPGLALMVTLGSLGACHSMGTPKIIYLARHGQTEWNRLGRFQGDPDLDPVGYINRLSLWMLMRSVPLDTIYTSQLLRTQRTAEPVAMQHKLSIQPRAALNEINPGVMVGVCYGELAPAPASVDQRCLVPSRGSRPEVTLKALRGVVGPPHKLRLEQRLPLGENYFDLQRRIATFVAELERGAQDRQVLIVGHGVVNRILLHFLMGWSLEAIAHLRQENDQVYRLEALPSGGMRLSLYTPGVGWKACLAAPRPGQRELDCNPGPPRTQAQPDPSTQPTAPGTSP